MKVYKANNYLFNALLMIKSIDNQLFNALYLKHYYQYLQLN